MPPATVWKEYKMTTNQQSADYIAALLRERDGYEVHGRTEKVAEVNAELKRIGAQGKPPAKRATKLTRADADGGAGSDDA